MKLQVHHTTRHEYGAEVRFGDHSLYLRPRDGHRRRVKRFEVLTNPFSAQRWIYDAYGNSVLVCDFGAAVAKELVFEAMMEVECAPQNPFDFILEPYAVAYPFKYVDYDRDALTACMDARAAPGELKVLDWFYQAVSNPVQHPSVVQFLIELTEAIRRDIAYVRRDEEGIQSPDETLQLRSGSCRDMAVLFISIVRQLGLAARFVSGYLYDPPSESTDDHLYNRAVGSMHAWVEVYLPGAGWKGFDPTNGILANENFLPTGFSHLPSAVNPIQGAFYAKGDVSTTMSVDLKLSVI